MTMTKERNEMMTERLKSSEIESVMKWDDFRGFFRRQALSGPLMQERVST